MSLIGRVIEQKRLLELVNTKKSEFIVLYGRRRTGKTYLIRELFKQDFSFYASGLDDERALTQLAGFHASLRQSPYYEECKVPANWLEAFEQLQNILIKDERDKKIIFIDELPWLETNGSDLKAGLDRFWNVWASGRKDIKLIVCGSAAAWMMNTFIDNSGGFYNRATEIMKIHNNYINALNAAIKDLQKLPFSSRLLKKAHKVLLQGARGEHKMPGEFRISQNWVGGPNINTATFVPPAHTSIHLLMADIEKLAHEQNNILPHLLKIALIHYQFETIHPFLDGNGRIGRLMITLYLVEKNILTKPFLYLSDFLEKNRSHYYDNLRKVQEKNDLLCWFKFFLTGVIETANKGIATFDKIMQLEKLVTTKINTLGKRSHKAQLVINYLYKKPILNAQIVQKVIGSKNATAYSLLADLVQLKILKETSGNQRNRTYIFEDYIKLFN